MRDFVSNNNPTAVYKIIDFFQNNDIMPDFLDNYEIPSSEDLRKYASTAFADETGRKFPILDPASTVLSAACYFGEGGNEIRIEEEIMKAAEAQGVSDWVHLVKEVLKEEEANLLKQASFNEQFALVVDDGDTVHGYLPVDTYFSIQESARGLSDAIRNRSLPLTKAASAATIIVKRAYEMNMSDTDLPDVVLAFGTKRIFDPSVAEAQLALRKRLVDSETAKVYEGIFKSAATHTGDLEDHVEMLEDMDRDFIDFAKHGYTGLLDAYSCLHGGITEESFEKLASEYIVLSFGEGDNVEYCEVPVRAFLSIPSDMIKVAFRTSESEFIQRVLELEDKDRMGSELDSLRTDIKSELLGLAVKYSE